jgi:hypothetical protein
MRKFEKSKLQNPCPLMSEVKPETPDKPLLLSIQNIMMNLFQYLAKPIDCEPLKLVQGGKCNFVRDLN